VAGDLDRWLIMGLAGCASDPAPEVELAAAEVGVEDAEQANAPAQGVRSVRAGA
jgi:hypothetical protein